MNAVGRGRQTTDKMFRFEKKHTFKIIRPPDVVGGVRFYRDFLSSSFLSTTLRAC